MILGVISDSHDDVESLERVLELFQRFGIDELIHLGDLISPFSLGPILSSGIPFRILRGNNDADVLVALKSIEGGGIYHQSPVEVDLDGTKLLLFHGFGDSELTKFTAISLASSGRFDLILYGHTHEVHVEEVGETLITNPGELCGKLSGRRTAALLDTELKKVEILDL
ncbi:MAG: metallophosphoesterase [Candidatus Korarchaeum sp.]|nr:metallophosphoesterase [Candidatus Korarchaeum sp.]MDW8035498.1 metallophosphoesterase [Candidatus Korarchaeum sp.]